MKIVPFRRRWFFVSGVFMILSFLFIFVFGFNLGLDFTGGSRWELAFEKADITVPQMREFFVSSKKLSQEPRIQITTDKSFLVTLEKLPEDKVSSLKEGLKEKFGEYKDLGYRTVDSSIGKHFKVKAFYALLMALLGIILYVAFAFRQVPKAISPWRFGAVSIFALVHDVVILIGVYVVLGHFWGVEMDLPFLTALLATFAFSMNDTIVILDRVRENVRFQKAHESFSDTVEKSLWETMARSIATSVSTLIPLITLLFFGAHSIFYFVLALAIGIIVGTYSSIFIAAPLLVEWKDFSDRRK